MTDDELRQALFEEFWKKLEALGNEDLTMANLKREPWAFTLTRHAHLPASKPRDSSIDAGHQPCWVAAM